MEPPLNYNLKIGNQTYSIAEGEEFEVERTEGKSKAVLVADKFRVFPYQGIRFKYPSSYSFEADISRPSDKNWTLSGNDCKIMVLKFAGEMTPKQFAESLKESFGEKNTKIRKSGLKLGGKEYQGATVDATIAGTTIRMEIAPMKAGDGWSKLFVVQDSLNEEREHSRDYLDCMKVLRKSFVEKD